MADLKVLLAILLDKAAQKDMERGLDAIEKQIAELDDQDFNDLADQFTELEKKIGEVNDRFADAKERAAQFNQVASKVTQIGVVLSAAGGAIVGAYSLSAKNYIDFIEEAGIKNDDVANRWIAATKRVENAQLNLGASAAQALLPYLEKAAGLIERIAQAAEQNPEAVKTILGAGVGLSIFGVLASAVGKGIKLYGDALYIAALADHSTTMKEHIAALTGASFSPAGGVGGAGGAGGIGKTLGTVTLLATSVIIGAELGAALGNALGKLAYGEGYKKQGLNDALLTSIRLAETPAALLAIQLKKLGGGLGEAGEAYANLISKQDKWLQEVLGVNKAAEDGAPKLRDYAKEAEEAAQASQRAAAALKAQSILQNLAAADAQAERKYAADVRNIYASSGAASSRARQQLKDNLSKIDQDLDKSLSKLAKDFAEGSLKAEQDYQEQRAKTIQEANENVRKIREQAQEQLLQLEQDHADRLYDLGIARDALGIIQENRRYEQERADINRETQEQIAETRRQAQIRLAEQRKEFIQSQNERRIEYQQRVAEERAQAEQRRKEAEIEFKRQEAENSRATSERLAELRRSYLEEQRQRRQAAYEQLKDVFQSLQQERQIKQSYYNAILAEARSFMQAYQNTLRMEQAASTKTSTSTRSTRGATGVIIGGYPYKQAGGYGPGFVERGDEFVLNPATTRAAETLIGNRLNQNNLLGALRGGGSVNWNDSRRFYAGISPEERRLINDDTIQIIESVVGGA